MSVVPQQGPQQDAELRRIRKFWNKPPAPTFCSACKKEIAAPSYVSAAGGIFGDPPCPHCGARAGWTSTFTTGGRDAKADINYLLAALSASRIDPPVPSDAEVESHILSTCPTTDTTVAEWIYGRPVCWGDSRFVAAHQRARAAGDRLIAEGRIERRQSHNGGTVVWAVPSPGGDTEALEIKPGAPLTCACGGKLLWSHVRGVICERCTAAAVVPSPSAPEPK